MLSKNQIKYIRSLHLRKYRDLHGIFIAEGARLVNELLNSHFSVINIFYVQEKAEQFSIPEDLSGTAIPVSTDEMERITALSSPSPVLALVKMAGQVPVRQVASDLVLVLDDIRDPGNMGTIIRIADWFGIHTIVTSETSVDLYNPKVVQATMGSVARVMVSQEPLVPFLEGLPEGTAICGAFMDGDDVYTTSLPSTGIIIIGNEANGISPGVARLVNRRLSIPPWNPQRAHAESLNASVATAIICSEFRRRSMVV